MRILAGWDDPVEAELLQLYLAGGNGNEVFLTLEEETLLSAAAQQSWDVVLHTIHFPTSIERGMANYLKLKELLPGVPIVVACRSSEIINLPGFLLRGLRFYLYRDAAGDYMFLVLSVLESAVAVAKAEKD